VKRRKRYLNTTTGETKLFHRKPRGIFWIEVKALRPKTMKLVVQLATWPRGTQQVEVFAAVHEALAKITRAAQIPFEQQMKK
jgi:hypothetical protein